MKFFIDTANVEHIREAASWGIVDGVTTNPTLVSREGKDFRSVIDEIVQIVDGPISAECVTSTAPEMIPEARELASWHPNIVVKIPMTREGIKAVHACAQEGIKTNVTLCFSPNQILIAAKAGGTYASPFLGRLDDAGHDGMAEVRQSVKILEHYGLPTQIIAASIRHPLHVVQAALAGAHVATIPYEVMRKLFDHPLTDVGIERFLRDWEKVQAVLSEVP